MSAETPTSQYITNTSAQTGSVPKWRGILLILGVTIGIVVLYYYGSIGKDWLNRLGIIFNALTGLLFAPAVLDTTGVYGRFVRWLEPRTHRIYGIASAPVPILSSWFERFAGRKGSQVTSVIICLVGTLVLISGFRQSGLPSAIPPLSLFGAIGFVGVMYEVISRQIREQPIRPFRLLLLLLLFPFIMLIVVVALPILFVLLFVLRITSAASAGFHGTLTAQEQLRSALIAWGILIFLVGNVLQFIATF